MEFTKLEKDILAQFRQSAVQELDSELSLQLANCTLIGREITSMGFFTSLGVPPGTPNLLYATDHIIGSKLCASELEVGGSTILHCSESKLGFLEVCSYAGEPIFAPDGRLVLSHWWFEEEKVNYIDLRSVELQ